MILAICVSGYFITGFIMLYLMWRKVMLPRIDQRHVSINVVLLRLFLLFVLLWPYTLGIIVVMRFSPKFKRWIETGVLGDE